MANIPEVLLYTLDNLGQEDLKTFQWHLNNGVEGFTPIQKGHLEKADRPDTVDKMVQRYGHRGAVNITLAILKKMNQNQRAEDLRKMFDGGDGREEDNEDQQSSIQLKSTLRQLYERVELLSAGLKGLHCKLEILRLTLCNLGKKTCENLESVLKLEASSLKELDISNNDLQDSGVKVLSAGLKSSNCKLGILRLSGCMITEEGCSYLASALRSNPSNLKELDLTYNHPGESGVTLLSARLDDPLCSLNILRVEHGGEMRLRPGLRKYSSLLDWSKLNHKSSETA
ncbi:hypothetical protein MHYP_G00091330 [Metynnis hypsauchen]